MANQKVKKFIGQSKSKKIYIFEMSYNCGTDKNNNTINQQIMQAGILTKKLNTYPKKFEYTITRDQLRIMLNNVFSIAISLDSEYYVFHKLFKMLDEIQIIYKIH